MPTDDTNREELEAVLERARLCDIDTNTTWWETEEYGKQRKPISPSRSFRLSKEWRRIRKNRMLDFGHICPVSLKAKQIHVHHIDFNIWNNEPENLIPLWKNVHVWIHARAGVSQFYKALDRAILLSITKAWNPE